MRHLNGPALRAAPLLPLISSAGRVSLLQAIALAPVLAVDVVTRGPLVVPLFVTGLAVALFWEYLFAFLRHADFSFHGLTTVMLVTLFAPLGVEAWQLAVAVSLGVVLGELVFGGRGFGFVNPAAASLALLVFSFPQLTLVAPELTVALATLPGAILLLIAGLISWRVLLATSLIALAAIGFTSTIWDPISLAITLSVGIVFLIADPVSAACTNPGRWAYGTLAGFLTALFAGFSLEGLTAEAVVFAALLASLFAPLIDHLMVLANAYNRKRRHARGVHG